MSDLLTVSPTAMTSDSLTVEWSDSSTDVMMDLMTDLMTDSMTDLMTGSMTGSMTVRLLGRASALRRDQRLDRAWACPSGARWAGWRECLKVLWSAQKVILSGVWWAIG